jgi:hypothetical protein
MTSAAFVAASLSFLLHELNLPQHMHVKFQEAKATTSKPKGILVKNDPLERERPSSFVFLRSKTVQRSAWDKNPAELTYKPCFEFEH